MTETADETCAVTARHPELDMIGCELPAGHDGPHKFNPGDGEGFIEWDDDPEAERAGAAFDVERFVRNLPDGVCLCPMCLGMGGVVEEPPFDPTAHMCNTCRGRGKVRTGSQRSDQAERDCPTCGGRGWQPNEDGEPDARPASAATFAGDEPPRDYAGRTPDDPEFDWTRVPPAPAPEPEPAPA